MDIFQSIILGIVQGLTEFLPVSSSGHLSLLEALFGFTDVPLFYDVMLHIGTLAAVCIVLWPEIVGLLTHPVRNKLGMLILATVPAAVVTLVCEKAFPEAFQNILNGKFLAFGFFGTTAVLLLADFLHPRKQRARIELPQALVMGAMQACAIIPGLSRSGSTIAGGLFCGIRREKAARYAFLMAIPTILGGLVFSAADVAENGMGDVSIPAVVTGTIAAAHCGYFAIRFMLRLISRHRLWGFAVYTAALGVLILIETQVFANPTFTALNPFA